MVNCVSKGSWKLKTASYPIVVRDVSSYQSVLDSNLGRHLPSPEGLATSPEVHSPHQWAWVLAPNLGTKKEKEGSWKFGIQGLNRGENLHLCLSSWYHG